MRYEFPPGHGQAPGKQEQADDDITQRAEIQAAAYSRSASIDCPRIRRYRAGVCHIADANGRSFGNRSCQAPLKTAPTAGSLSIPAEVDQGQRRQLRLQCPGGFCQELAYGGELSRFETRAQSGD
jgi:hypothetical protein